MPGRAGAAIASMRAHKFIEEPMGKKLVTAVPGINEEIGRSLNRDGITLAKELYGHYLMVSKTS